MADVSVRQLTALAVLQSEPASFGRLLLPAVTRVSFETTGALESAVGYTGTAGNLIKQNLASFQTAAPETNITLDMEYMEKSSFELLAGQKFSTGTSPVKWNALKQATVGTSTATVTDTGLVGLPLADFDVNIRTATGATITCEKISTGSPTASQVAVTIASGVIAGGGTMTFHDDYKGATINYTLKVSDAVNTETIGGPGVATPKAFNQFALTGIFGVAGGHVKVIAPKVTKSTEFSFAGGEKTTFSVKGRAETDLANGYTREIAYYWMKDLSSAFI